MSVGGALAALLLSNPAHGYQLQSTLESELGPLWDTRASQIYLTLGRMERDGLITVTRVRQENLPDRRYLELTSAGRRFAMNWLQGPGDPGELVVRIAVARLSIPERFEELAASCIEERSATLARLRAMRTELSGGFQAEALDAEILRVRAELRWIASVREKASELLARPANKGRRRAPDNAKLA